MPSLAIVDANPLVAWADIREPDHARIVALLERADIHFVVGALVLVEACYMVQRRLGALAEQRLVQEIAGFFPIECPSVEDYQRMAALMFQYRDFPLGAADASIVALAERLGTDQIVTFDYRHFATVRPAHVDAFVLLPN
jgi:predicted nucleic acid-binding protein